MSAKAKKALQDAKSGKLNIKDFQSGDDEGNDMVTVSNWGCGYESPSLGEIATVTPIDSANSIPVLVLTVQSLDGATTYCASIELSQAAAGSAVLGYVINGLFDPSNVSEVQGVVSGLVSTPDDVHGFSFSQNFPITG